LLAGHGRLPPYSLERLCQKLCPSLDVNVNVQEGGEIKRAVASSDWIEGDGFQLLIRAYDEYTPRFDSYDVKSFVKFIARAALNMRLLIDENGEKIGRACVALPQFGFSGPAHAPKISGAVTVGGLLSCRLAGIAGVLAGTSRHVSRNVAVPLVSRERLAAWATEQADLVPNLYDEADAQAACGEIIRLCGGSTKNLPIAIYQDAWVSYVDVSQNQDLPDEILLLDPMNLKLEKSAKQFVLESNVMLIDHSHRSSILQPGSDDYIEWPDFEVSWGSQFYIFQPSLGGAVVEALAEAWGVSVEDVLSISDLIHGKQPLRKVGSVGNEEVIRGVMIIRRPG
jgi:hypothetical protein